MIDNLWIALALMSQRKRGTKISGLFLFSCQSLQRLDLFLKADVKSRDYRIVIHLSNMFLLTNIHFNFLHDLAQEVTEINFYDFVN